MFNSLEFTGVTRRSAIVALVILLSACGGKEQRLATHLERGKEFYAQGDFDKAGVELKNVLQIDPNTADAYFYSGLIEEKQQEWQKAFASFLKAIELDPANQQAKLRLGRIYLYGGDVAKAEASAAEVLAVLPEDPSALTLRAAILARKGESRAAMDLASKVVERDAAQVDAVALLAGLLATQGEGARAEETLLRGIGASPDSRELRLALISMYAARNAYAEAEGQYAELIRIQPEELDYRAGLARLQAAGGNIAEAEATLRLAIDNKPDDFQRYLLLADFLAARKSVDAAREFLAQSIEAHPKAYALQFGLAALHRNSGEPERAEQVLRTVIERDRTGPDGLRARADLADSRLRRGRPDEASTLIAEVLKENPRDNQALLLRGQLAMDRGDLIGAIADFRSVYRDQPNSVPVISLLSRAHLLNREPELARETLGKAVSLYPDQPEVRVLMAELKAATGDTAGAFEELATVLGQDADNFRALTVKADIAMSQRDWREAESALSALRRSYPGDARVSQRLGNLYLAQRRMDKAEAAYETALKQAPGAIEPLTGLANVYLAGDKAGLAVERVERSLEASPENFLAYALLGRLQATQGQHEKAQAAFRKAVSLNPLVAGTHVELSNYLLARGDGDGATSALLDGLKALPGDVGLSLRLAEAYRRTGKTEKAIVAYEEIVARDPGNDLAANNLASMLLDVRQDKPSFEKALALAQRFERSANPAYLDTLGWANFKLENYQQALVALRKAADQAPNVAIFQFHLGMALHKTGDMAQAKPLLQKAVEANVEFPGLDEARRILAAG